MQVPHVDRDAGSIPIGAGVFYPFFKLVVSPELAALLMAMSSVTVTLNTLLLRRFIPSLKREVAVASPAAGTTLDLTPAPARAHNPGSPGHGPR